MRASQLLLWATVVLATASSRAAEIDPEDLRPGLIATYRTGGTEITRLEPGVSLRLADGEAPHPRLAGGTATWSGYVNILRAGPHTVRANARGTVVATIGSQLKLSSDFTGGLREFTTTATLDAGLQPIHVQFARHGGPAVLELRWSGPGFRDEPLAGEALFHLPKERPASLAASLTQDHGRLLWEERGCMNCHKPGPDDKVVAGTVPLVGPNLSHVGSRVQAGWLDRWLADPTNLRPATAMPKLFASDEAGATERYAVGQYLRSLGTLTPPKPDKDHVKNANAGKSLFNTAGCVVCHPAKPADAAKNDEPGIYGAPTKSSVARPYPLDALGSKTTPAALEAFLKDPLALHPSGRMPNMLLSTKEARDLAAHLCDATDASLNAEPATPSAEQFAAAYVQTVGKKASLPDAKRWRELGKAVAAAKGCANCHSFEKDGPALVAAPGFASVRDHAEAGCLAESPSNKAANYGLSTRERRALGAFARDGSRGAGSASPTHAARSAFQRFNCLACHQRDGEGGIRADTLETLRRYEKAENAEGLTPPSLTGVGHKLLTPWLTGLLERGQRARPWMGLRMPQYGPANVGLLAHGLATLDGTAPETDPHAPPAPTALSSAGRQLIGKGGFGCISCHDYAGIANTGTRGPDLTIAKDRLRYDWYRRWLEQPQRMQPGTRMPQVFPDGQSTLTSVLHGHADEQSLAMWAYCALGASAALPDGLEPPKGLVLKVAERPVVARAFLPDIGSARGMAVGYPGGGALAFDAFTGRLAYAWSGNFVDAGPMWEQRGGQVVKVLGPRYWTAPPGPPWYLSASQTPPDFAARVADPNAAPQPREGKTYDGPRPVQCLGYDVDANGFPRFRYSVPSGAASLTVAERPEPVREGTVLGVRRHFALEVPPAHAAWLNVAGAKTVPQTWDGTTLKPVDSDVAVTELPAGVTVVMPLGDRAAVVQASGAPGGAGWLVQKTGEGWSLLLKVPGRADAVTVTTWAVPRVEAEVLRALVR